MSRSQHVRLRDLREAYRVIGECVELGGDVTAWRKHLVTRVVGLVGARVGMSGEARWVGIPRVLVPVGAVDGGWDSDTERAAWLRYIVEQRTADDPLHQKVARDHRRLLTCTRDQLLDDQAWYGSHQFNDYHRHRRRVHRTYYQQRRAQRRGRGAVSRAGAACRQSDLRQLHRRRDAEVNDITGGLGFHAGSGRNEIFNNTTGVNLTGRMQNQHVHDNVIGVVGSGILGGDALDLANLIAFNVTGADFDGTIQYNRFSRNGVGIRAHDRQVVIHNLIYRGTAAGVRTNGADDVRIVHNTFFNTSGNAVQVDGASQRAELLNNVFQSDGGIGINVAADSREGFFSDFNDLYSAGAGQIVRYGTRDYDDIVDLQQDLYRFGHRRAARHPVVRRPGPRPPGRQDRGPFAR